MLYEISTAPSRQKKGGFGGNIIKNGTNGSYASDERGGI
jgi:hypothetical protein